MEGLADYCQLLLCREAPPAHKAGDQIDFRNFSDIGVCLGLSLGPLTNVGPVEKGKWIDRKDWRRGLEAYRERLAASSLQQTFAVWLTW
jgi:hypothetical protein